MLPVAPKPRLPDFLNALVSALAEGHSIDLPDAFELESHSSLNELPRPEHPPPAVEQEDDEWQSLHAGQEELDQIRSNASSPAATIVLGESDREYLEKKADPMTKQYITTLLQEWNDRKARDADLRQREQAAAEERERSRTESKNASLQKEHNTTEAYQALLHAAKSKMERDSPQTPTESPTQDQNSSTEPQRSFASKVVFMDLEWHQLDKKNAAEMSAEEQQTYLTTAHICQICAISADYTLRFNQYVSYRKLAEPWRQLVEEWQIMEYSPHDDPRIAIPLERCMQLMLDTFPDESLFLFYGNTDAMSIFKALYSDADYDPTNGIQIHSEEQRKTREWLRSEIRRRKWRWANVQPWIKEKTEWLRTTPNDIKVQGGLSVIFDILYHHSLLLSIPHDQQPPEIARDDLVQAHVANNLLPLEEYWEAGQAESAFGLVPREWIQVFDNTSRNSDGETLFKNIHPDFWPSKHLQPVFHVAHTDTVMLLNCVALIAMMANKDQRKEVGELIKFLSSAEDKAAFVNRFPPSEQTKMAEAFEKSSKRSGETILHLLSTAVIRETWLFRKFQLALSEMAAREIYEWFAEDSRSKTSHQLAIRVYVLACKATGETPRSGPDYMDIVEGEHPIYAIAEHELKPDKSPDSTNPADYRFRVLWENNPDDPFWSQQPQGTQVWPGWDPADDWFEWDALKGTAAALLKDYVKKLGWSFPDRTAAVARPAKRAAPAVEETASKPQPQQHNTAAAPPNTNQTPKRPARRAAVASEVKTAALAAATPRTQQQKKTAPAKQSVQEQLPEETEKEKGEKVIQSVVKAVTAEFKAQQEFETTTKQSALYFRIRDEKSVSVALTKRSGKFTDKVKAIRKYLIAQAEAEDNQALMRELVRSEHTYASKRQTRFPMQPNKSYIGLPWFSLPTTDVEPHTHMLHTLACRNLSDPEDRNKTRNFAELETMLWDFDLIARHNLFINTRFRFCKECKEYTTISNLGSTGIPHIDHILQEWKANRHIVKRQEPMFSRQHKTKQLSSSVRNHSGFATQGSDRAEPILPLALRSSSSAFSSVPSVSTRHTRITVSTQPYSLYKPLTPLLSFLSIQKRLFD